METLHDYVTTYGIELDATRTRFGGKTHRGIGQSNCGERAGRPIAEADYETIPVSQLCRRCFRGIK